MTSKSIARHLARCALHPERVIFLDIETTGLDPYRDEFTVIGWAYGGQVNTMVKGMGSDRLREDIRRAKWLVTFNGVRFDTKFLAQAFPRMALPRVHFDLMRLCRRVGLTGGQKAIEHVLGIGLRDEATRLTGAEAVALWRRYIQGDSEALQKLILYNRADVAAMGAILDEIVQRMGPPLESTVKDVRFRNWSAPLDWQVLPAPRSARLRF